MSEAQAIRLETAAIIDTQQRVLLVEGRNYGWELPGTKVEGNEHLDELSRALMDKLGIWVAPTYDNLPSFASTVERELAGVAFSAHIHRVVTYEGRPMETVASGYRRAEWINPLKLRVGRMVLSPIAEYFCDLANDNPRLLISSNRVQ